MVTTGVHNYVMVCNLGNFSDFRQLLAFFLGHLTKMSSMNQCQGVVSKLNTQNLGSFYSGVWGYVSEKYITLLRTISRKGHFKIWYTRFRLIPGVFWWNAPIGTISRRHFPLQYASFREGCASSFIISYGKWLYRKLPNIKVKPFSK